MTVHPQAGQTAPPEALTDIAALVGAYRTVTPAPHAQNERVSFGTSGHRGTATNASFNEQHIIAICAAIVEHRRNSGIDGPLFVGRDTHALSEPAFETTLEVLAAHDVAIVIDSGSSYTPTPVISHAILAHNNAHSSGLADGIIITPSHNPPEDGGFKYNPPTGGPADTDITSVIQRRANEILEHGTHHIRRAQLASALQCVQHRDLGASYIADLRNVLDMDAIAHARLRIGVDPLGGASIAYWDRISDQYGIDIDVVNRAVDPAFAFMKLDWDGRIRMDCSSPHAMAGLIALRDRFDVAFACDPDADRHGIVTRSTGLMNPNHFLAVAIHELFRNRPDWPERAGIGKTLVSSSFIDRVAQQLGRPLVEVPVGFKWFVTGLMNGDLAFGGEESAGASFVRRDGTVWTTDKDGILLALLAAEITARAGRDPGEIYRELTSQLGEPSYERIDAPATAEQKKAFSRLTPQAVRADTLAGETITARLTTAPGNGASFGGLKVTTENGWFAARPSGTEEVYKIYAESFLGRDHLRRIQAEAQSIVAESLRP